VLSNGGLIPLCCFVSVSADEEKTRSEGTEVAWIGAESAKRRKIFGQVILPWCRVDVNEYLNISRFIKPTIQYPIMSVVFLGRMVLVM
jgi:hypothetical protein